MAIPKSTMPHKRLQKWKTNRGSRVIQRVSVHGFYWYFFQIIWFFVGKDDDKTKHESESEPMDTDQEKKAGLQETEVAGNSKE